MKVLACVGYYADIQHPATFADGRWHHLAYAYDGAVMTVFYDGAAIASGGLLLDTWPNTTLTLATTWIDGPQAPPFTGALDEVLIYDRALSAAEVQALAVPPSPTASPTASVTPIATVSATALPADCDASAVRRFVGFDVDGVVLQAVLVSTERECRVACCAQAACAGYVVEVAPLLQHGGSTGAHAVAGCFLRSNITQLVPASTVISGVVLARVPAL